MVMTLTAGQQDDCKAAYNVAVWLEDEQAGRHMVTAEAITALTAGAWPEHVGSLFPSALAKFGSAAMRAAVADMPSCGCRWGLDRFYRRQAGLPGLSYVDPALRVLYRGDPCRGCEKNMMDAHAALVAAAEKIRASRRKASARASTMVASKPIGTDARTHRPGCLGCYQRSAAISSMAMGLVASGHPVAEGYVSRGHWHVEEHPAMLPGGYAQNLRGQMFVTKWLKAA
jgi:hypothetical protein